MFAVVKAGGKQYKVEKGDVISVEKIDAEIGSTVELGPVLMTGGEDSSVEVGAPVLEGRKVSGKIIGQNKGPKIVIWKHRRRKNYRKKQGHRQSLTTVEIVEIS